MMKSLTLRGVQKSYGGANLALRPLDLQVEPGEFLVFVGPSGCGKSTLLRMIAGLETITGGDVEIGGTRVNDLPPAQRGVSMVFQNYALYPHMTVAENMGFGLKMSGAKAPEVKEAVSRAAEILQITPLLDRKPKALSGGQRQRVAIGRAIVRKSSVFLFDEPLSNLDASLRVQMRMELARLHRELGTTMIYVTHDQVEAMTLGDRIAVFNTGSLEQVGAPLDLYHNPKNRFVASFLGTPKMNFISGHAEFENDFTIFIAEQGERVRLPLTLPEGLIGKEMTMGVRPEDIQVCDTAHSLKATVEFCEHLGDTDILYARVAGVSEPVAVRLPADAPHYAPGAKINLGLSTQIRLFNVNGSAIVFK